MKRERFKKICPNWMTCNLNDCPHKKPHLHQAGCYLNKETADICSGKANSPFALIALCDYKGDCPRIKTKGCIKIED